MKLQTLFALAFSLPGLAMAQTFPCDRGNMCNTQPSQPVAQTQQAGENIVTPAFIKNINLSESQRYAISQVVQNQMPSILLQERLLKDAHAVLREMAVSRQYDEAIAKKITTRIADSSATLALLQAEREYQVYALLSPEQASQFDKLDK